MFALFNNDAQRLYMVLCSEQLLLNSDTLYSVFSVQ